MTTLLAAVARAPAAAPSGNSKILFVPMETYGFSDLNGAGSSAPYILGTLFAHYAYASGVLALGHNSAPNYLCFYTGIDCHSPELPPNVYSGGTTNPDYDSTIVGDGTDSSKFNGRTTIFHELHTAGKVYAGYYDNTFAAYRDILASVPSLSSAPVSLPTIQASSGSVTGAGTLSAIVAADLDSRLPDYAFAQPSNAHNMHDSGISAGDTWLAGFIPAIQATNWYTAHGGTIVILWDEQDSYGGDGTTATWQQISGIYGGAGGTVTAIVVSQAAAGKGNYSTASCTAGVVGSITDALGLSRLGTSVGAPGIPLYTSGGPTPYDPHGTIGGTWTLVFDDEFSGSAIDTTKWAANWYGEGGVMNTAGTYAAETTVAGGYALLELLDSSHGALIHTNGGSSPFTYTTGYVEARILFPGDGTNCDNWPAFWTTGLPGTWPTNGEIDIAEGLGTLTVNYHSSHGADNGPEPGPTGYSGAFHVYGVHRYAGFADVYWDGVLQRHITTFDGEAPHEIVVNVGSGEGPAVTGTGSRVQVDYVRAWH